jgi:hypothetical protein
MNTFWLKAAGGVVIVVGLIILVNVFKPSSSQQKPKTTEAEPNTFYNTIARDDKRLRVEPNANRTRRVVEPKTLERYEPNAADFKELSDEERVDAEKLFEMAMFHRKQGRLPGMGSYKLMVDYCRQIIQRYPDTEYAFKARRMLGDLPARFRQQYNITDEEINPQNK